MENSEIVSAEKVDSEEARIESEAASEADRDSNIIKKIDEGAGLEEINRLLAEESAAVDRGTGVKKNDAEQSGAAPEENAGSDDGTPDLSEEEPEGEPGQEPGEQKPFRIFKTPEDWQRTIDSIIADRFRKLKGTERQYDELLGLSSRILGVEKEKTFDTLRNQLYEQEAEREGVSDIGLYKEMRRMREEIETQKDISPLPTEQDYKEQAFHDDARQRFNTDIGAQITTLKGKFPEFDIQKATENPRFNAMFGALYQSPATRGEALERAYAAIFYDEIAGLRAKREAEKITAAIKQNRQRVPEGASLNTNSKSPAFDIDNMTDEQFAAIERRLKRGEKVQL